MPTLSSRARKRLLLALATGMLGLGLHTVACWPSGYEAYTPGPALPVAGNLTGTPLDTTLTTHSFSYLTVAVTSLDFYHWYLYSLEPSPERELVAPLPSSTTPLEEMRQSQQTALALASYLATGSSSPPPIGFSQSGVGGPSAGLLMTLTALDALSPGDLSAGLKVTGTGTIDAHGNVGAVGGVALKLHSAIAAHQQVFLVDPVDYKAMARTTTIKVVKVSTVLDAVSWLCAHGATDRLCSQQHVLADRLSARG